MKSFKPYLWLAILFIVSLTGCMSDLPEVPDSDPAVGEKLRIRVSMPQNEHDESAQEPLDSRVHYDDQSLNLTWETGDQLRLVGFDAAGHFVGTTDFNLTGKVDTFYTVFEGNTVPGATQYDIYYLCSPNMPVNQQGELTMTYDGQRQSTNNSTLHLKKNLFIKSVKRIPEETLELETEDIELQMQNSIMRFDFSNIPDNFIKSIKNVTDLEWKIGDRILSMTFDNIQVNSNLHSINAFMCFEGMNANQGDIIHVILKGNSTQGLTKSEREYQIKVESPITFEPNNRYYAELDMQFNLISGRRIYYTSDVELTPSMFSPKVVESGYDQTTGKGFVEFDDLGVLNSPIRLVDSALANNGEITRIHFEGGVDYIGANAFKGCTKLQKVVLPTEMRQIGSRAFSGCNQLSSLELPATINVIQDHAFDNCTALPSVVLPEGIQTLNKTLFENCTDLTSIEIPSTVTNIEVDAFTTCTNLSEVHLKTSTPPTVSILYPLGFSQEQIDNPLGFNLANISIYVPTGSQTAYEKFDPILISTNKNPWYPYRGKYIEE